MKKSLLFLGLFLALFAGAHVAWADSTSFVPLTNIPAITQISDSTTLSSFFNNLYKIAIGVAASLAVLQIMFAGFTWMTAGGNSENVSKARAKIGSAIFGLVLILSPAIVFQIINPSILNLNIGFSNITPAPLNTTSTTATSTTTATTPLSATTQAICKGYSKFTWAVVPTGKECSDVSSLGAAYATIDNGCCTGSPQGGAVCCGYNTNYQAPVAGSDGMAGPYSFSMIYEDTIDDPSHPCLATDNRGSYPTQAACETAAGNIAQTQLKGGLTYAYYKMCSEASSHSPTPADHWAKLSSLPMCSN